MTDTPALLTIQQAAARITAAGIPTSVATLRSYRTTWPEGDRKGPMPLLLTPGRLRYTADDCDRYVRDRLEAARAAATGA